MHALIESVAAHRPTVFAIGAAAQGMDSIDLGGGKAGAGCLSGKICRRNKTYDERE